MMEECKKSLKVVRYPKNDVFNRKLDLNCVALDGDVISPELTQLIKETTDKIEVHNLKVHEVLIELEDLKNFIHDNFYDAHDTSVVLDHLDKIYEDVSNLEVR